MDKKNAIKIALIRAGKTQVDIAKKCGVKRACVANVIAGKGKSQKVQDEIDKILEVWGAAL